LFALLPYLVVLIVALRVLPYLVCVSARFELLKVKYQRHQAFMFVRCGDEYLMRFWLTVYVVCITTFCYLPLPCLLFWFHSGGVHDVRKKAWCC